MNLKKYNTETNRTIIATLICLIVIIFSLRNDKDVYNLEESKKEIATYKKNIDSLKVKLKDSDYKIDSINNHVAIVDSANWSLKKKISSLLVQTNKKVEKIDNYTKLEVDSFLVNRYQDHTIVISPVTGKKVITDLVTGDSAKEEVLLVKQQLVNTETKVFYKDNIILEYKNKGVTYENVIKNYDYQIKAYEGVNLGLNKELKKQKRKNIFTKIGSGLLIGGLTYLYITK